MSFTCEIGQPYEVMIGEASSLTEQWFVFSDSDQITDANLPAARAALIAATPAIKFGLLRTSIKLKDFTDYQIECEVGYGIKSLPVEGEVKIQIDGEGGREKITQALAVVGSYGIPGRTPANSYGAIGVQSDGSIEGVEIEVSGTKLLIEFHVASNLITDAYLATISRLAKRVNNAAFKGYEMGELRFQKYTFDATRKLSEDAQPLSRLTLEFIVEANVYNLKIGGLPTPIIPLTVPVTYVEVTPPTVPPSYVLTGAITIPLKRGHEYLWVYYEELKDAASKISIKRPVYAYVNQVYHYADFTAFGLGT